MCEFFRLSFLLFVEVRPRPPKLGLYFFRVDTILCCYARISYKAKRSD